MKSLFAAVILMLTTSFANADPINYDLILNVSEVQFRFPGGEIRKFEFGTFGIVTVPVGNSCSDPFINSFACPSGTISNRYVADFTIDDSVLALEGSNLGTVTNFFLQIGEVIFDQNNPSGDGFSGFRDAVGNFTDSPGVTVQNNTLVCLQGSVFASGDVMAVDFFCDTFVAFDIGDTNTLFGSLAIQQFGEPGGWLLFSLGLIGIAGALKHQRNAPEVYYG
jgi:hypothetical protein